MVEEFYKKAEFVKVTPNGVVEAQPHLMDVLLRRLNVHSNDIS